MAFEATTFPPFDSDPSVGITVPPPSPSSPSSLSVSPFSVLSLDVWADWGRFLLLTSFLPPPALCLCRLSGKRVKPLLIGGAREVFVNLLHREISTGSVGHQLAYSSSRG